MHAIEYRVAYDILQFKKMIFIVLALGFGL